MNYKVNDKVLTTDDKVGIIQAIEENGLAEIKLKDGRVVYRYLVQILRKF